MSTTSIKSTRAEVPHLAIPLRYIGGKPVVNEQDSIDDIHNCVEAIIRYPKEFLEHDPDFGVTPLEFEETNIELDNIRREVLEHEPRADNNVVRKESMDEFALNFAVRVGDSDV